MLLIKQGAIPVAKQMVLKHCRQSVLMVMMVAMVFLLLFDNDNVRVFAD